MAHMSASRIAAVLLVAVATFASACVPVHNVLADRDLVCKDIPDDLCLRVAEVGLARLNVAQAESEVGRVPAITVREEQCLGRGALRCWSVEARNDQGGIGVIVFLRSDGSLAVD
jgi:hypothetical protein